MKKPKNLIIFLFLIHFSTGIDPCENFEELLNESEEKLLENKNNDDYFLEIFRKFGSEEKFFSVQK